MKQPIHAINQSPRMTPERIVGLGFVGVLHVLAIWAIVTGLGQKILRAIEPPPIVLVLPRPDNPPPPTQVKPPEVMLPKVATTDTVPPPIFTIQDDVAPRVPAQPDSQQPHPDQVAIADSAASGITNTHSTPPYPPLAQRMSQQGKVLLHLTISADGNVAGATVTQSSGFEDLDQSAVAWVLAHWKYRPAIRGGMAVASAADAVVVFNLKNAR